VRPAGPGRGELGPEGGDQQDPKRRHPIDDQIIELEGGRVAPLRILEQHHHRLPRRQPLHLRHQRPQRHLLLLLRGKMERRVALAGGERQQRRQQRRGLAKIVGRLGEHRLQLVEARVGGVLAPEPGCPFEVGDRRVERMVLVVRRAEHAEAGVRLGAQPLEQGLGEARLADPRLARDQHDAALAALGLPPAPLQHRQLLVAADEWGGSRAQRLEAALGPAFAQYPRSRDRRRQALDLDGAQILVVEQHAGQPPRARADHHRPRLGQRLQPRREVRRLADNSALRRRAR
jgi:hypothetical protein